MRTTLVICLALTQMAAATAYAATQDPYSEVNAMRVAFAQVRSVTATERFSNGEVATVQFNLPDRFHITTGRSQIILTGDTEYVKRAPGRWAPSADGGEHQTLLAAAWQLGGPPSIDVHDLYMVTALGTKTIGMTLVRGFLLHDANGGNDETVWIGPDNLPVAARIAMLGQTIEIHYTGYNTSERVATPI